MLRLFHNDGVMTLFSSKIDLTECSLDQTLAGELSTVALAGQTTFTVIAPSAMSLLSEESPVPPSLSEPMELRADNTIAEPQAGVTFTTLDSSVTTILPSTISSAIAQLTSSSYEWSGKDA